MNNKNIRNVLPVLIVCCLILAAGQESMHGSGGQENTPAIRTFQMDAGGIGNIRKSVNLFRGDVNIPLNLVSLPGRGGLDVNLTAMYQGNVHNTVFTRNMEAPTGILGVGWSLPIERIIAGNPGNGSKYGNQYYLITGSTRYTLVRITTDNESGSDTTPIQYKTNSFNPWKVTYYPAGYKPGKGEPAWKKECWEIIRENGVTSVYGGGVKTGKDNNNSSQGNSIQWGVRWGNWYGTSTMTDSQQQFALAWNLYQMRNSWGDAIIFEYEEGNRGQTPKIKNF